MQARDLLERARSKRELSMAFQVRPVRTRVIRYETGIVPVDVARLFFLRWLICG